MSNSKTWVTWLGVVSFGGVAAFYLLSGDMANAGTAGLAALALLGVKMLPEEPKP